MPNVFNAEGLQVSTRDELIAYFTQSYQTVYGTDINLEQSTPDGQWMLITVQIVQDLLDFLVAINASFDPDEAIGNILNQRVAINGIQRQEGTYTETNITLVNNKSVNLYGLDQAEFDPANEQISGEPVYTISDSAGNRWFLKETELGLAAGSHVLLFRAETPGANLTIPNTIQTMISIVLGVVSVNNPTTYSTLGTNEETDGQLKIRRMKSVSIGGQGYLDNLEAALQNIPGVTSAYVYENNTSITDGEGVPSHSIWAIVAGSPSPQLVAEAIYSKRGGGEGMKGDESYVIIRPNGNPFTVKWDYAAEFDVVVILNLLPINASLGIDYDAIRNGIPVEYVPDINQTIDMTKLGTYVQSLDPNSAVESGYISQYNSFFTFTPVGTPASGNFKLGFDGVTTANISWNANGAAIKAALDLATGLSFTVLGDANTGFFTGSPSATGGDGLVYVAENNILNGASNAVRYSVESNNPFTVLAASSPQNAYRFTSPLLILLPMFLTAESLTVDTGEAVQLQAYGGYGPYRFGFVTNNSGGTINASTGLYTAGVTPGTDQVRVFDGFDNNAIQFITVV